MALQHSKIPDHLGTVFAGVDRDATDRARSHMTDVPPSSPAIALFKEGQLIHMLERRHIERMSPDMVATNLTAAFDTHCNLEGPSVPREVWERSARERMCGSGVPIFNPTSR